jgi:hypothetical protein
MPPPDFDTVIRRLHEHNIAFVLIGGMAAMAHGASLVTFDVDVCSSFDAENLFNIQKAFADVHPIHRMTPQKLPLEITPQNVSTLRNLYLNTDIGVIDFLSEVTGVGNYAAALTQSVEIELPSGPCRVLAIDALIHAKQSVNRTQDKIAIAQLLAIKQKGGNL